MSMPPNPDGSASPGRTPDLPCPKCGDGDVSLDYQKAGYCGYRHRFRCEYQSGGEHFHRYCRRCRYEWSTKDVVDGGKAMVAETNEVASAEFAARTHDGGGS